MEREEISDELKGLIESDLELKGMVSAFTEMCNLFDFMAPYLMEEEASNFERFAKGFCHRIEEKSKQKIDEARRRTYN